MLKKRSLVIRLSTIAAYGFTKLASPLFNVIISLIIIRMFSDTLWGEFVSLSLIANLALLVIAWGNKEYLMKAFSESPANVAPLWIQAFYLRGLLYPICVAVFIIFVTLPADVKIGLALWTLALYIHRSFEVLILYYRHFNFSTTLEISGNLCLILGILLFRSDFTIVQLLGLHIGVTLLKCICLILFYKKNLFQNMKPRMHFRFYREATPFFLPSVVGFLQSKADIYVIALSLTSNKLAQYQIFINLLSIIHQIALLMIAPYTKNIYRLNDRVINRLAWNIFKWGSSASLLSLPACYFVIAFYYRFSLPWSAYCAALILMPPLFFYSIKTYQWFKHNGQYKVVVVNLLTALASLLLSITLVPAWEITGALVANCCAQWLAFFLFLGNATPKRFVYEQR